MPTKVIKPKRKVPIRRSRATSDGNINVKHQTSDETIHVVNLKKPLVSERIIERPVFNINQQDDYSPEPRHWSFKLYRKIALSFVLIAVILLGAVAYFVGTKLEVVITPRVMPVNASSNFSVYDRPASYNLPASSIFGIVRAMETTYEGSYPVANGKVTGAEVTGQVIIYNKYIKDQPLVATTRLLTTNNQLLHLKDTVVVPAGGSIQANVYGETADPSFALADSRLTIPGLWAGLQDKIYAEAKIGDVTYKEIKQTIITQSDLDNAIAEAKKALLTKATAEIESVYNDYDEKLYQLDDKSIAFSFDSKVGDQKSAVKITMTSKVVIVAFKKASLVNLNKTTLDSGLGDGQSLVEDSASAPSFKVSSSDVVNNIAVVELLVVGSSTAKSDTDLIDKQKLIGLNRKQIESYISGLNGIDSYELHFTPSFLEVAPQLVDRITVRLK